MAREDITGFQKTADQLKKANKKVLDLLESMIKDANSNRIREEIWGKNSLSEEHHTGIDFDPGQVLIEELE